MFKELPGLRLRSAETPRFVLLIRGFRVRPRAAHPQAHPQGIVEEIVVVAFLVTVGLIDWGILGLLITVVVRAVQIAPRGGLTRRGPG